MSVFRELKRRRVLHTLSLYVVGCWIALQVVEVLSQELPPSAMRHLLIAASLGFPIVLGISWFFDISASGIRRTRRRAREEELPKLNLADFGLLAGLIAVIALDIYILSSPPQEPDPGDQVAMPSALAVLPFADAGTTDGDEPIGEVIANELRREFTKIAGLRVVGPETSRAILLAKDLQREVATELGITKILTGAVQLREGQLSLDARLLAMPTGHIIWQDEFREAVSDGIALQKNLIGQVLDLIVPAVSAETTHRGRAEAGDCQEVYDLYLRGKAMINAARYESGRELLDQAVRLDPDCAIAWEAVAVTSIDWSKSGFAKAGAAARRALELNDALPEAWSVLAEIAEEERRWSEAEELFLRALYVDPTNAHANTYYSEALLARGRVRESLHYALEAYRYEPASQSVNYHVALSARYAADADTLMKHALIYREIRKGSRYDGFDELFEAYLLAGDTDQALAVLAGYPDKVWEWYGECVDARENVALRDTLRPHVRARLEQALAEPEPSYAEMLKTWQAIRCGMWIGENDAIVDFILGGSWPTERQFFVFFQHDASGLRQHPRFNQHVVETGLLEYWRDRGFSDFCEPEGDSFACD
jgi:TolB-like protein